MEPEHLPLSPEGRSFQAAAEQGATLRLRLPHRVSLRRFTQGALSPLSSCATEPSGGFFGERDSVVVARLRLTDQVGVLLLVSRPGLDSFRVSSSHRAGHDPALYGGIRLAHRNVRVLARHTGEAAEPSDGDDRSGAGARRLAEAAGQAPAVVGERGTVPRL